MTLVPAYGRDYKSVKAVKEDWAAGKDFIVADMFDPYDGKPCNLESAQELGLASVNIRYARLTKVAVISVIPVKKGPKNAPKG